MLVRNAAVSGSPYTLMTATALLKGLHILMTGVLTLTSHLKYILRLLTALWLSFEGCTPMGLYCSGRHFLVAYAPWSILHVVKMPQFLVYGAKKTRFVFELCMQR